MLRVLLEFPGSSIPDFAAMREGFGVEFKDLSRTGLSSHEGP